MDKKLNSKNKDLLIRGEGDGNKREVVKSIDEHDALIRNFFKDFVNQAQKPSYTDFFGVAVDVLDRIVQMKDEWAFRVVMECFDEFAQRVEGLCDAKSDKSLDKWLDNEDVCLILNTSKRTLQTYRDNGILQFTQIGHKTYYHPEDIEQAIKTIKCNKK